MRLACKPNAAMAHALARLSAIREIFLSSGAGRVYRTACLCSAIASETGGLAGCLPLRCRFIPEQVANKHRFADPLRTQEADSARDVKSHRGRLFSTDIPTGSRFVALSPPLFSRELSERGGAKRLAEIAYLNQAECVARAGQAGRCESTAAGNTPMR